MTFLCSSCAYNSNGGHRCHVYELPKQQARDQCNGDYFVSIDDHTARRAALRVEDALRQTAGLSRVAARRKGVETVINSKEPGR